MMAVEPPPQSPSILSRSTSIFRRLSRRESRTIIPLSPLDEQPPPTPRKLQRRSTTKDILNRPIITHLHTIQVPDRAPTVKSPAPRITSRRRVLASDMRTTPFPASPSIQTVPWNVFLTPEQVYSLVSGYSPREMEDKWFIYAEGPDPSGKLKVHFHRSWTGMKIAELFTLIDLKGEGAGKIVGIKWNGSDQTNGLEQEEVKYMITMACSFVLGVDLEKGML